MKYDRGKSIFFNSTWSSMQSFHQYPNQWRDQWSVVNSKAVERREGGQTSSARPPLSTLDHWVTQTHKNRSEEAQLVRGQDDGRSGFSWGTPLIRASASLWSQQSSSNKQDRTPPSFWGGSCTVVIPPAHQKTHFIIIIIFTCFRDAPAGPSADAAEDAEIGLRPLTWACLEEARTLLLEAAFPHSADVYLKTENGMRLVRPLAVTLSAHIGEPVLLNISRTVASCHQSSLSLHWCRHSIVCSFSQVNKSLAALLDRESGAVRFSNPIVHHPCMDAVLTHLMCVACAYVGQPHVQ